MKSHNILPLMALLLAVLIVCSQLSIPVQPVPITLQTFAVLIIGMIVPPKAAFFITLTYTLMGFIGLPVFAGYKGGIQSILSPTFGFVLSFIIASTLIAFLLTKFRKNFLTYLVMGLLGTCTIYLVGLPYLGYILNHVMGVEKNVSEILQIGMLPFLFGDIIKVVLAAMIANTLEKHLTRS